MPKIKITEEQAKNLLNEILKISDTEVDKAKTTNPMDGIKKIANNAAASPDINRAINNGDVAMSVKTSDGYDVSAKKNTMNEENVVSFKKLNEMKRQKMKENSELITLNEFFKRNNITK